MAPLTVALLAAAIVAVTADIVAHPATAVRIVHPATAVRADRAMAAEAAGMPRVAVVDIRTVEVVVDTPAAAEAVIPAAVEEVTPVVVAATPVAAIAKADVRQTCRRR